MFASVDFGIAFADWDVDGGGYPGTWRGDAPFRRVRFGTHAGRHWSAAIFGSVLDEGDVLPFRGEEWGVEYLWRPVGGAFTVRGLLAVRRLESDSRTFDLSESSSLSESGWSSGLGLGWEVPVVSWSDATLALGVLGDVRYSDMQRYAPGTADPQLTVRGVDAAVSALASIHWRVSGPRGEVLHDPAAPSWNSWFLELSAGAAHRDLWLRDRDGREQDDAGWGPWRSVMVGHRWTRVALAYDHRRWTDDSRLLHSDLFLGRLVLQVYPWRTGPHLQIGAGRAGARVEYAPELRGDIDRTGGSIGIGWERQVGRHTAVSLRADYVMGDWTVEAEADAPRVVEDARLRTVGVTLGIRWTLSAVGDRS
ncbi:MAG: hypothetical protein R6X25_09985 [Candidatus Krumholzibacteriia bacterium]